MSGDNAPTGSEGSPAVTRLIEGRDPSRDVTLHCVVGRRTGGGTKHFDARAFTRRIARLIEHRQPDMPQVHKLLHRHPRLTAAFSFGLSTALLTHFAWYPDARFNGMAPVLTLAAGGAHALSGAVTGARLVDPTRTRTKLDAALTGAVTSLIALVLFAPAMAAWVSATGVSPHNPLSYVMLTLFTGVFAFLGAGWALLLACVAVALALHHLAASSAPA